MRTAAVPKPYHADWFDLCQFSYQLAWAVYQNKRLTYFFLFFPFIFFDHFSTAPPWSRSPRQHTAEPDTQNLYNHHLIKLVSYLTGSLSVRRSRMARDECLLRVQ